jgi:hypothetical protein
LEKYEAWLRRDPSHYPRRLFNLSHNLDLKSVRAGDYSFSAAVESALRDNASDPDSRGLSRQACCTG